MIRCAICLYVRNGVASEADTIINGQAVCYDHMGWVAGGEHSRAIALARKALADDQAR